MSDSPLIIALDSNLDKALNLVRDLSPEDCKVKIGNELFISSGSEAVKQLNKLGFDIFLDLKFHDIPNTVGRSIRAAAELGIWMINVHSSGGSGMLKEAFNSIKHMKHRPLLVGVTLLTSQDSTSLTELGLSSNIMEHVLKLARLSKKNGLDGVVCSAREISTLRKEMGDDFILVTPGIRSNLKLSQDQKRTATVQEAIENGSNYLVIGREITESPDPIEQVNKILEIIRIHT